jgi:hypothetical protein
MPAGSGPLRIFRKPPIWHDPVISLRRKQTRNQIDRDATDDLIRTVFEIDVRVQRHSDGTPLVLPQLMTAIEPHPQGMS